MIHPIFLHLCLWCLVGVFGVADEVKSVSVMEGESVILQPNFTNIQKDDQIRWNFGHKDILIAQINSQNNAPKFYNGSADGRFIGRLKLDQTGSLTITNLRTTDSGLYQVKTTRSETPLNIFSLIVCESRCCSFNEAVIRLGLSSLVGVAVMVVLVYEFRTRNLPRKKTVQNAATNTDQPNDDVLESLVPIYSENSFE
ncbi:uncharacterized protein LOC143735488 [Siphateles boraxobius]|uniref:uncharacterized protein LOC143735488 n=1 Tax=Siphateles boraxobius TaxID=180520 RepID=UPI0040632B15